MHLWTGEDTLCEQVRTGRLDLDNYRIEAEPEKDGALCFGCNRRQQQHSEPDATVSDLHQREPDALRALQEARKAERAAFAEYMAVVRSSGAVGRP